MTAELRDKIVLALDGWHRLHYIDSEDATSGYEAIADALMPLITQALRDARAEGFCRGVGDVDWDDDQCENANPYQQRAEGQ